MSNPAHSPEADTVTNEHVHTHPEMTGSVEQAERQASIIDHKGRRMDPAWTFLLIGGGMIAVAVLLFVLFGAVGIRP